MLSYEKIFSRVRGKIDDPRELSFEESILNEIYVERLHNSLGNPRIRNLFESIQLDDENQEMSYKLRNSIDDFSDDEFIIELLAIGMMIEWLEPKVTSVKYTAPMIGGKEEKKVLDNHKNMIERLDKLKNEQKLLIRDYGYINNSYLRGV